MMWTTHQVQIAWGCRRAGGSAPDDAVGWLGAAARGVVQRSEAHDNGQRNACPRQVQVEPLHSRQTVPGHCKQAEPRTAADRRRVVNFKLNEPRGPAGHHLPV